MHAAHSRAGKLKGLMKYEGSYVPESKDSCSLMRCKGSCRLLQCKGSSAPKSKGSCPPESKGSCSLIKCNGRSLEEQTDNKKPLKLCHPWNTLC